MDPNATLVEIREIVAGHQDRDYTSDHTADRLVELVEALDGWLTSGGFLPAAWVRA